MAFYAHLVSKPVPSRFSGFASGDTYTGRTYGDDTECPRCSQRHPVRETTLLFEVNRQLARWMLNARTPGKFMMGVLRDNAGRLLAASSPADGQPGNMALASAARAVFGSQVTMCGNLPDRGTTSRGGVAVTVADMKRCRPNEGEPIGGRCAAPKLLHFAIQNSLPLPWTMSEIWYDPDLSSDRYDHVDTAPSCATCANLLPLILCGRVEAKPAEMVSFSHFQAVLSGGSR